MTRQKFAIVVPRSTHAACFRELQEAVHFALLQLGHESVIAPPGVLAVRGYRSIVFGWHLLAAPSDVPPDSILYNLEQAADRSLELERVRPFADFTWWDWSAPSSAKLKAAGARPRLVPMGYAGQLERIPRLPDRDRPIDLLFYGSLSKRRRDLFVELERRFECHVAFGCYGPSRDRLIQHSKLVLNVHQEDGAAFEWVRVSYLLANACCVLSEGPEPEGWEGLIACAPYGRIGDVAELLLDDPELRASYADRGQKQMKRHTQAEYLELALAGRLLYEPPQVSPGRRDRCVAGCSWQSIDGKQICAVCKHEPGT